jgi:hypothetical protein
MAHANQPKQNKKRARHTPPLHLAASEAKKRSKDTDRKMIRTVIRILPRQYNKYQKLAYTKQRTFAILVRGKVTQLLESKNIYEILAEPKMMKLIGRLEDTMPVQLFLPAKLKRDIDRFNKSSGILKSGLFRAALDMP